VLPVDAGGRVLLLLGYDPADPGHPFWFTIGGGTAPGESVAEAAARELHEEAGIAADVAPCECTARQAGARAAVHSRGGPGGNWRQLPR
jgi:8-oxo-dGTP pyrophosphatase MutT (NUDIX family)